MLEEDMMASSVFAGSQAATGGQGGSFQNTDTYATGDARVPHALGSVEVRRDKRSKKDKDKDKKKSNRKVKPRIPNEAFPMLHTRETGMTGPSDRSAIGTM